VLTVQFKGKTIAVKQGQNLRQALLNADVSPYNGTAFWLNCHGLGTCGTCAVEIKGAVSPKTKVEKWRINFPPHNESHGLRLACQCTVQGDLELVKHAGFWGEKVG
jgi:ferredoxin